MKRLLALGLGLLSLVLLCLPADGGGGCQVRAHVLQTNYTPTYAAAAVVTQTYDPVVVTQLLAVPAYGVGYGQPDQSAVLAEIKAELSLVKEQNRALMLQIVQATGRGVPAADKAPLAPTPPPMPAPATKPATHPGLAVFAKNCASCHDTATKAKGGNLAFLSGGQFGPVDFETSKKIGRAVLHQTMPPGRKLGDDEATQVLDLLNQ